MMKKLLAMVLAVVALMTMGLTALADDGLAGGWTATADAAVTDEAAAAFAQATEGMTGSLLEPIALLATQVVAGTNYCLLCRSTPVVPDAVPTYVLAYVYAGVDGTVQLLGFDDFDIELPDAD